MTHAAILLGALVLDAVLGEPAWLWPRLPHPAVVMGRLIGWFDKTFNKGEHRRLAGALGLAVMVCASWTLGAVIEALPGGEIASLVLAAILIAQKSLAQHVGAVADALRLSVGDGRLSVARIVGRDTRDMDAPAIARAAIESAAENMSDGVVAPAFWFLVFGLPGLLVYKLVNTADSMIGYRTPRHEAFGWASARFDDLLNWLPARLTTVLIWIARPKAGAWAVIRRDAPLHRSPNAGWPEAAMAAALGIALSGPRSYAGEMRDFPYVNVQGERLIGAAQIDAAVAILWRSWAILLGLAALIAVA